MYVSGTRRLLEGEGTEVVRVRRNRVDTLLQALADGAIWLLFKGNRVRS
jgi:hypothetical protein